MCPMMRWSAPLAAWARPPSAMKNCKPGTRSRSRYAPWKTICGGKIYAIVIGEIGGGNALGPMVAALQCLACRSSMATAWAAPFPELQMDTFMIYGLPRQRPFVLADSAWQCVSIFTRISSAEQAEDFARSLTIEMGGSAALVMPVMNGAELKATIIRDTRQPGQTHRRSRARLPRAQH